MMTVALLLLFVLLCTAFSDDRAWDNVTKPERNTLVFEGRLREYGAYAIRREYDRRFILAFFGGVGFIVCAVLLPGIFIPSMQSAPPPHHWVEHELSPDVFNVQRRTEPAHPPQRTTNKNSGPHSNSDAVMPVDTEHTPTTPDTSTTVVQHSDAKTGEGTNAPDTSAGKGGNTGSELGTATIEEVVNVDSIPVFPGGQRALEAYVRDHVRFDASTVESGADKVFVLFVVEPDGSVSTVQPLKGHSAELRAEAARVVRTLPRWRAAWKHGRHVPCRLVLPISFEAKE